MAIRIVIADTVKTILNRITTKEIIPKEMPKPPILSAIIVFKNVPDRPINTQNGKEINTLWNNVLKGISAKREIIIGYDERKTKEEMLYLEKEHVIKI